LLISVQYFHHLIFTGYGIFTTRPFEKGEFLLQYIGEEVTEQEAEKREMLYEKENKGSFIYFYKEKGKTCW
jgi:histone-lysine N-methyltransferase SETD8